MNEDDLLHWLMNWFLAKGAVSVGDYSSPGAVTAEPREPIRLGELAADLATQLDKRDGLDKRFDEVFKPESPSRQATLTTVSNDHARRIEALERRMDVTDEIVKIAELKAMNLGPNTFRMALDEWRAAR